MTSATSRPCYPYTRSEECSWQPEDVARHLAALAGTASSSSTQLLSHGWSTRQIASLRMDYGSNRMEGDSRQEEGTYYFGYCIKHVATPIVSALASQLKEPLILMLLGSASLSVLLGKSADAISISCALLIVGLVAAVQEYRSEAALEKLAYLVPHTCTVLRDGRVLEDTGAWDLVLGDLVLLSTGEYVPCL
jgi:magnesium-transporting ATPase (P-type)